MKIRYCFEAGHSICDENSPCSYPHGHSWVLEVQCFDAMLSQSGHICKVLSEMIEQFFMHKWLNSTLNTSQPTLDFIVNWIRNHLVTHKIAPVTITLYQSRLELQQIDID